MVSRKSEQEQRKPNKGGRHLDGQSAQRRQFHKRHTQTVVVLQLQNGQRHSQSIHAKRDFYSELVKLCEDFGYKPVLTENKKFKGYFIPIEQKVCIDEDKNNIFIKKIKEFFDNDK